MMYIYIYIYVCVCVYIHFFKSLRPAVGPTQPSTNGYPGFPPEVKRL